MNQFDSIRPPEVHISDTPPTQKKIPPQTKTAGKKIPFKKILLGLFLLFVIITAIFVQKTFSLSDKIFVGNKTSFFDKLKIALSAATGKNDTVLKGENEDRINILVLGIGGENHEGPYLTDTIILAQIQPKTGKAVLTSIPRDLLARLKNPDLGMQKINSAFAEGLGKDKNFARAGEWALASAEDVSGMKIPYFAVVDFSGFENGVDKIGGLDIYIDRTFTDAEFPNDTLGYLPPLTFNKGPEHMNGKRALQFARSRHGNNNEGSDYARSLRQQKVISAFKTKLYDLNLLTDVGKVNALLNTFANHFHTNLRPQEILRLYSLTKNLKGENLLSLSLDEQTGLVCPKILEASGAWVLFTCPGKNQSDIWNFFKNSLYAAEAKKEQPVIWLADASAGKTRFKKTYDLLTQEGYTVYEFIYTPEKPIFADIVYQATPKPASAQILKNKLSAAEVFLPPPGMKVDPKKVDIIIILGDN